MSCSCAGAAPVNARVLVSEHRAAALMCFTWRRAVARLQVESQDFPCRYFVSGCTNVDAWNYDESNPATVSVAGFCQPDRQVGMVLPQRLLDAQCLLDVCDASYTNCAVNSQLAVYLSLYVPDEGVGVNASTYICQTTPKGAFSRTALPPNHPPTPASNAETVTNCAGAGAAHSPAIALLRAHRRVCCLRVLCCCSNPHPQQLYCRSLKRSVMTHTPRTPWGSIFVPEI